LNKLITHTSISQLRRVLAPCIVNFKKGTLYPWSVVLSGYSGFCHH